MDSILGWLLMAGDGVVVQVIAGTRVVCKVKLGSWVVTGMATNIG
jgi:hypothetical protein